MEYNRKLLGLARARLAETRDENLAEHARRLKEAYEAHPEIQQADALLASQMAETAMLSLSLSAEKAEKLAQLGERNLDAQIRREELLTSAGYPSGWLDDIYSCPLCKDTGSAPSGGICSCLDRLYRAELSRSLSSLPGTGSESFSGFDLSLYPAEYSSYFRCSPREYMAKVKTFCCEYAEGFSRSSENLLFTGGPGLGKTFLASCIARAAAGKGYSVCYETAVSAFRAFEREQFARSQEDYAAAADRVRQFLECDLLILDDLGTEVVTPVVLSGLYTLINSRSEASLPTLIILTPDSAEPETRYSPAIASRLKGLYKEIRFAGDDIRVCKHI